MTFVMAKVLVLAISEDEVGDRVHDSLASV